MKKLFTILAPVLLTATIWAQSPQKMSYQEVIRDATNQFVTTQVAMRITIILGPLTPGTSVYVERQITTPNANGLVTIEINGPAVTHDFGTFAGIDWSAGEYYIKTETDINPGDGSNYTITGTSQLLSVPYALHAKTGENVTGTVAIANGGTGATSISGAKTNLGLGNVDNSTDLLKPVSTATQTALDLKAPLASPTFTGTVSGITKSMVGLENVDNTTDLLKPFSTATQTALDLKAPIASPTFTGTVSGITSAMVGLGNVDNTTDLLKPVSTATQAALDLKAPLASPTFTGTVSGITKSMVGLGNVDNTADLLKPISTATQTALDLKAPLVSPTFTRTPLAPTATPGTNTTQIATTAFFTSAIAASVPAHYIGEVYGGGKVFFVYDNGQHGLIAATADLSTGIKWYAGINKWTLAWADGVGAGKANTATIIASQGTVDGSNYAAIICHTYSVTENGVTYGDWYLPSKHELYLLYLQKSVVGWYNPKYWSSTEYDNNRAWLHDFVYDIQDDWSKNTEGAVRAIRSF